MKFNAILFSTALAVTSMFTVNAHADNSRGGSGNLNNTYK